ncbi:PIN domain-containing protein [Candidatus Micrarchaeota archaeon]|nr:PIN domain-containing protein [Candidatus Micrarchaeota archaeon]
MAFIDSWAWIEMFRGTEKGAKVREIIKNEKNLVSSLTLAEISFWSLKSGFDPEQYLQVVKENSTVIDVDQKTAEIAGKSLISLRKKSPGIGMIDAIIYSQSLLSHLDLLTGDSDFKNLSGVEFIG